MKILSAFILIFPLFCFGQSNENAKKQIDADVAEIDQRTKKSERSFVLKRRLKNRKTAAEMWTYSTLKSRLEFLKIAYRLGNTDFSEIYYLKKGGLIFATESEVVHYNDKLGSDILNSWSGRYYFFQRKLFDAATYEHGKSEADDWNPEKETLTRLTARLKQWRRKLKSRR